MNEEILNSQPTAIEEQQNAEKYLMAYDRRDKKAKGVTGIDADGNLETADATSANQHRFMRVDQGGNIVTNFYKNFLHSYRNPMRFVLYSEHKSVKPEDLGKKIELVQQSEDAAQRKSMNSSRIYNDHNFNACEVNWELAERYGITQESLEKTGELERLLTGKWSNSIYNMSKESELGREGGDAKLSLFRDDEGRVKFDIHFIRQVLSPGEEFRGYKLEEQDVENLNKIDNMGKLVNLVVNYTTGETQPCIVSKDPKTNDMFYMTANQIRVPAQMKGHTFTEQETTTIMNGKQTDSIEFKSSNGKTFYSSVQANVQERGIKFCFERGLNQSRNQEQHKNQQEKKNLSRQSRSTIKMK